MLDRYLRSFFSVIYSSPHWEWLFEFIITIIITTLFWLSYLSNTPWLDGLRGFLDVTAIGLFLLFLYKIRKLYKFESEKIKVKKKVKKIEEKYYNKIYCETQAFKAIESITEEIDDIALWKKDSNHKFVYLSKYGRGILFKGKPLEEIIGLTDAEIVHGCRPYKPNLYKDFKEKDLEKLYVPSEDDTPICNLTDYITQFFGKPCKYFEEPKENLGLLVWKTPIYTKEGNFDGTVGAFIDCSKNIKGVKEECEQLRKEGRAYKIDNTGNYYMLRN